jgi:4-amino-4-deoxy-L-arabinose transferase-like glycosyltransferase
MQQGALLLGSRPIHCSVALMKPVHTTFEVAPETPVQPASEGKKPAAGGELAASADGVRTDLPDTEQETMPNSEPEGGNVSDSTTAVRGAMGQKWVPWLLALAALGTLFVPLSMSGLWDPQELRVADFGRRIAVNFLGASNLVIDGAVNDTPTLEEVSQGELPLFLVAVSFKLFGLHGWAGRLPMAVAGCVTLLALYWTCRRLSDRRTAELSVLVLLTAPLFFTQSRTILGAAVTMALLAASFGLLAVSAFDTRCAPAIRAGLFAGGIFAMAGTTLCRGVLVGVGVPALSVGLAWLLLPRVDRVARWIATTLLGLGVIAVVVGGIALGVAQDGEYWRVLGLTVAFPSKFWTHDQVLHFLGHAFFPWSALAPVAVAAALTAPPPGRPANAITREASLRLSLLLAVGLGILAYAFLGQRAGALPFTPVFALSALVAVGMLEWDRRPEGSPPMALFTVALLVLLIVDFQHFPEKALSAFATPDAKFPDSFKRPAHFYLVYPGILCAALLATLGMERLGFLRRAYLFIKPARVRIHRRWLLGAALGGLGALLSLGYYPALASQLSPMGAFRTYTELARPGEPLASVGSQGSANAYYGTAEARNFGTVREAMTWLLRDPTQRRWLVVKDGDLAKANALYRRSSKQNVPVLDARSSGIQLLSNELREGERNSNRFSKWLPETRPTPAHAMDTVFSDRLRLLGWEIQDSQGGAVTDELRTGHPYEFRLYYQVLGRIAKEWKTFIHIDGQGRRFNGDHDTLNGEYPFRNWNKGDYIADIYPFEIEPSFTEGRYQVYFGLFSGKKRYTVSQGEHKDDRVNGGVVTVIDR